MTVINLEPRKIYGKYYSNNFRDAVAKYANSYGLKKASFVFDVPYQTTQRWQDIYRAEMRRRKKEVKEREFLATVETHKLIREIEKRVKDDV